MMVLTLLWLLIRHSIIFRKFFRSSFNVCAKKKEEKVNNDPYYLRVDNGDAHARMHVHASQEFVNKEKHCARLPL
jgi:hypothetical protein